MGEAVSDFLVKQYNPYLAVFAGFVMFAIATVPQTFRKSSVDLLAPGHAPSR
jgi:hypothetical protein